LRTANPEPMVLLDTALSRRWVGNARPHPPRGTPLKIGLTVIEDMTYESLMRNRRSRSIQPSTRSAELAPTHYHEPSYSPSLLVQMPGRHKSSSSHLLRIQPKSDTTRRILTLWDGACARNIVVRLNSRASDDEVPLAWNCFARKGVAEAGLVLCEHVSVAVWRRR